MMYVYACVVGIKAPESLCYLLMYINPTLNKDYLRYLLFTYPYAEISCWIYLKTVISKYHLSSHSLSIEIGRLYNIERNVDF
jgi:hypothetical protein